MKTHTSGEALISQSYGEAQIKIYGEALITQSYGEAQIKIYGEALITHPMVKL